MYSYIHNSIYCFHWKPKFTPTLLFFRSNITVNWKWFLEHKHLYIFICEPLIDDFAFSMDNKAASQNCRELWWSDFPSKLNCDVCVLSITFSHKSLEKKNSRGIHIETVWNSADILIYCADGVLYYYLLVLYDVSTFNKAIICRVGALGFLLHIIHILKLNRNFGWQLFICAYPIFSISGKRDRERERNETKS